MENILGLIDYVCSGTAAAPRVLGVFILWERQDPSDCLIAT